MAPWLSSPMIVAAFPWLMFKSQPRGSVQGVWRLSVSPSSQRNGDEDLLLQQSKSGEMRSLSKLTMDKDQTSSTAWEILNYTARMSISVVCSNVQYSMY